MQQYHVSLVYNELNRKGRCLLCHAKHWNSHSIAGKTTRRTFSKKILDSISPDYKNLKIIGGGSFAQVYKAIRIKGSTKKPVAIRIVVTRDEKVFKHEKKPTSIFENLKNEEKALEAVRNMFETEDKPESELPKKNPDYYNYISVPKLKYMVNATVTNEYYYPPYDTDGPTFNVYGIVSESELADRDAWPERNELGRKGLEYSAEYIKKLILDVAKALKIWHQQRRIHNDLKPDNILIKNNGTQNISFQLTDFGVSWKIKEFPKIDPEKEKNNIETEKDFESWVKEKTKIFDKLFKRSSQNLSFSAPEKIIAYETLSSLRHNIERNRYQLASIDNFIYDYNNLINKINVIDARSDIYSFGKIIEYIAIFELNHKDSISDNFTPRSGNKKDTELKKLIDKMMDEDPARRPTLNEILNDDYVKDFKMPDDPFYWKIWDYIKSFF